MIAGCLLVAKLFRFKDPELPRPGSQRGGREPAREIYSRAATLCRRARRHGDADLQLHRVPNVDVGNQQTESHGKITGYHGVKTSHHGVKTFHHGVVTSHHGVVTSHHGMKTSYHGMKTAHRSMKTSYHVVKTFHHRVKTSYHGKKTAHHSVKTSYHGKKTPHHIVKTSHHGVVASQHGMITGQRRQDNLASPLRRGPQQTFNGRRGVWRLVLATCFCLHPTNPPVRGIFYYL